MLTPVRASQFKRDVKRLKKRGKDMSKLRRVLDLLIQEALAGRLSGLSAARRMAGIPGFAY